MSKLDDIHAVFEHTCYFEEMDQHELYIKYAKDLDFYEVLVSHDLSDEWIGFMFDNLTVDQFKSVMTVENIFGKLTANQINDIMNVENVLNNRRFYRVGPDFLVKMCYLGIINPQNLICFGKVFGAIHEQFYDKYRDVGVGDYFIDLCIKYGIVYMDTTFFKSMDRETYFRMVDGFSLTAPTNDNIYFDLSLDGHITFSCGNTISNYSIIRVFLSSNVSRDYLLKMPTADLLRLLDDGLIDEKGEPRTKYFPSYMTKLLGVIPKDRIQDWVNRINVVSLVEVGWDAMVGLLPDITQYKRMLNVFAEELVTTIEPKVYSGWSVSGLCFHIIEVVPADVFDVDTYVDMLHLVSRNLHPTTIMHPEFCDHKDFCDLYSRYSEVDMNQFSTASLITLALTKDRDIPSRLSVGRAAVVNVGVILAES